jgi:hypothetical protein
MLTLTSFVRGNQRLFRTEEKVLYTNHQLSYASLQDICAYGCQHRLMN